MSKFSLYLIKPGFSIIPRFSIDNLNVVENNESVFSRSIYFENNPIIINYIESIGFIPTQLFRAVAEDTAFVKYNEPHDPWWKTFWNISDELNIQNVSAVVFKELDDRLFVFVHGFGRFLLNPYCLEYDFGLRTAVNLIDDSQLRTAGLFTPSEIGLRTIKQSGKHANINEYDINIYNTMLKNIAGKVKNEYKDYFQTISGADSITFSYSGNREGLFERSKDLYRTSKEKSYLNTGLYWIDNFKPVRDFLKIAELDSLLLNAINSRSDDIIIFFPEVLGSDKDIYFSYSGIKDRSRDKYFYPYLDTIQYYNLLDDKYCTSIQELLNQSIIANDRENWVNICNYTIYQCIYFECKIKDIQYFIEGGTWYIVDNDFYNQIEISFKELTDDKIDFDFSFRRKLVTEAARHSHLNKEYIFNKQLTEHLCQYDKAILLDSNTVSFHRNQIEICDVLYKSQRQTFLIHNKYKYGSSALSHLFSQGNVSANCITDLNFRKLANDKINLTELKFSEDEKLDRENINIVYGIIGKPNKNEEISIPVFSKINLKLFSDNLKALGYTVKLVYFIDDCT